MFENLLRHLTMKIELTAVLAVWGASTGTLVLFWDIYKWIRSQPQIALKARPNIQILGSPQISSAKTFIDVEAVNRGDRATTITNLGIEYYGGWFARLRNRPKLRAIIAQTGFRPLPLVLKPGERWSGIIDQSQFAKEVYVRFSHLRCPGKGKRNHLE